MERERCYLLELEKLWQHGGKTLSISLRIGFTFFGTILVKFTNYIQPQTCIHNWRERERGVTFYEHSTIMPKKLRYGVQS